MPFVKFQPFNLSTFILLIREEVYKYAGVEIQVQQNV